MHIATNDVMLDEHVMVGVGNVYRCEVLWAAELSPWAHVGDLSHADAVMIVNQTARLLRVARSRAPRSSDTPAGHRPPLDRPPRAAD